MQINVLYGLTMLTTIVHSTLDGKTNDNNNQYWIDNNKCHSGIIHVGVTITQESYDVIKQCLNGQWSLFMNFDYLPTLPNKHNILCYNIMAVNQNHPLSQST